MEPKLIQNPLGFWEIKNKPTPEELQQYYASKYFQEARGSYEHEYTPEELYFFKIKLEQRFAVIRKFREKENGSLLDVGCGEGYTLDFFRKRGWSVKGFDFSSAGIESKNPDCLDATVRGDIYRLLLEEVSAGYTYDVIWLQNVLEHVIDPLELLKKLRCLISHGGIAVVTVPNDFSITQQSAKKYQHIESDFWVVPPDHLNYFSSESLHNVSDASGWKCVDVLADFPVDWFLFHPGSNYISDKSQGKDAHRARVQLEVIIHQQPIDDVIRFWSGLGKIGMGRDITGFLLPS